MTTEQVQAATMQQLRVAGAEKAKSLGMPTSILRTQWKREQIEEFLLTGDVPVIGSGGTNGTVDKQEVAGMLVELLGQLNGGVDPETVRAIVLEEVAKQTRTIEVKRIDLTTVNVGVQHNMFESLLTLATIRENVMLVGGAGSGKTTTCHNIARDLNIEFYAQSVGGQTTKSDLIGYMDAKGAYSETILYKAYKNGGFYLLDEIDAGNANVLTSINSLLANGSYRFPNGENVTKHPDFICMAAGNTTGHGANRKYVGRNQQDGASLDRFLYVAHDYDETLERAIAGNDEWTKKVQAYRHAAEDLKMTCIISPRASIKGAKLLGVGYKLADVEQMAIWKGMDTSEVSKIKAKAATY